MNLYLSITLLLGLCFHEAKAKSDRIKLKEVQVLTLKKGHRTTARRSSPIPQLMCVGGTARCSYQPDVVQCYNKGWDGRSVNWECKAELDKKYSFGQMDVVCEGYDHPDDSYILAGSCGLEYTINMADGSQYKPSYHPPPPPVSTKIKETSFESSILAIILFIVVGGLVYIFCGGPGNLARRANAPPPPGFAPEYNVPPPEYSSSYSTNYGSTAQDGPGFGTGFATGGVLGYLFARNSNTENTATYYPASSRTSYRPTYEDSSPPPPETKRDSSPTRVATGFATTKRR